eukprot:ANDGO_05035.mRNA.1 S-adenosylmethionine decarboxylase proenzyme
MTAEWYFEGPEKKLEIDIRCAASVSVAENVESSASSSSSSLIGLRSVPREAWQRLLDSVNATIISEMSNEHCTAYVLSESSLFVYPHKMVIKTCGGTTLLKAVDPFIADILPVYVPDATLEFLLFSRKNYGRPEAQAFPHDSFSSECAFLEERFGQVCGRPCVMGPLNGDHWYMYMVDFTEDQSDFVEHPDVPVDQTLEVMMHELNADVMAKFTQSAWTDSANEEAEVNADSEQLRSKNMANGMVARAVGIEALMKKDGDASDGKVDVMIDENLFTPCGYSMNGLMGREYATVHVTPEQKFSYVSFETNLHCTDYAPLVKRVLNTFKPGRVTVTLFRDRREDIAGRDIHPENRNMEGYVRSMCTMYEFSPKYDLLMIQYKRLPSC